MEAVDLPHEVADKRNGGAKLGEREQAGAQAVIDVVGVIGDIVSDRRGLRLEARMMAEVQRLRPVISEDGGRDAVRPVALGRRAVGVDERTVVLDEAGKRRPGQVKPIEVGVAALELGDDAQGLAVVVEAAVPGHRGVERVFPGMPEGGVAEVVAKRDRLGKVVVKLQARGRGRGRSAPPRSYG